MNVIIKHIELMERIDQLIRMQATGNSAELASRLKISKTKLYRIINIMKKLNAPIDYNVSIQSFVYVEEVGFKFGFYTKEMYSQELNLF